MTTAPVDPNISLPPAVKAAADRAAAVHAAAYNTPPETPPVQLTSPNPTPDAMVRLAETPVATPELVPTVPAFQPVQQPAPVAPAAPLVDRNWEADYRSMEGRVKQKDSEVNNLRQMLTQLSDEVSALRAAPPPLPANSAVPAPFQNTRRFVTDEDVKQFGPELQGFIERAAAQALTPIIAQVEAKVNQVNQGVAQRSQQQVWSALDTSVPQWRTVNRHPAFKAWSNLRDVKSGRVNGELLRDAFQLGDTTRTAAIFQIERAHV